MSVIVREHIIQKFFDSGVPGRVRLAQGRVPERVGLREAGLDVIFWIFGSDGGFGGAAVTGVYPHSFTDELDFITVSLEACRCDTDTNRDRTSLTTGRKGLTVSLSSPSNVMYAVSRHLLSGLTKNDSGNGTLFLICFAHAPFAVRACLLPSSVRRASSQVIVSFPSRSDQ